MTEPYTHKVPYHNHAPTTFEIRNPEAHIQKHWLGGAFYETSNRRGIGMLNLIYQANYRGGIAVDVGASIGNHTLFFACICQMTVYAIEPHLPSFEHLRANIKLNPGIDPHIHTIHAACGDHEGVIVTVAENKWNEGMVHVDESLKTGPKVRLATLDALLEPFCPDIPRIDLIKIDVEHYNTPVLFGMTRTLRRYEPDVFIECESPEEREHADIMLGGMGYDRRMPLVMNYTPTYLYEKAR